MIEIDEVKLQSMYDNIVKILSYTKSKEVQSLYERFHLIYESILQEYGWNQRSGTLKIQKIEQCGPKFVFLYGIKYFDILSGISVCEKNGSYCTAGFFNNDLILAEIMINEQTFDVGRVRHNCDSVSFRSLKTSPETLETDLMNQVLFSSQSKEKIIDLAYCLLDTAKHFEPVRI